MKVQEIRWDDELAWLFYGEVSVEDVRSELARMGYDPDEYTIGEIERFRRWPGQWNDHIERNRSRKLQGSFKARLVT